MKFIIIVFMILYLYSLSFGVFMTDTIRIPAPLLFCMPLIFLFKEKNAPLFNMKELWFLIGAIFCYYIIGQADIPTFGANLISMVVCFLYFNYFIGTNTQRYNFSITIFYALLAFSSIIMVLNHFYPQVDNIRGLMMDEQVLQSPSGIAISQFTFGYQLAALGPFVLIYTFINHKHLLIKIGVFSGCLLLIYLGMQRSVFITFVFSVAVFLLFYYRFKAVYIFVAGALITVLFYNFVLVNADEHHNIVTKNTDNDPEYNRSLLTSENLNIYANYPLGLVFYGKNWSDVIYRNQVFSTGITSHNAYLMFFTYLGPFLGLGLLIIIYSSILKVGYNALKEIRKKENALLICLCFSFLGISINSLSHNAWLVSGDGPTLFLYFAILHLSKIQQVELTTAETV